MFLDREREVRAAFYRSVIGDDYALLPADTADASNNAGTRNVAAVDSVGGQRGKLKKWPSGIEEQVDSLADKELAAGLVLLPRALGAAEGGMCRLLTEFLNQAPHAIGVGGKLLRVRGHLGRDHSHRLSSLLVKCFTRFP